MTDAEFARFRSAERFISSREFMGMKLGLDNVREFVASLGNPQSNYPTIHVAGTNGKGSTVSMLGSILRQAGYRTGVFTSPHLVSFRERIAVDGRAIDPRYVTRFVERHRKELSGRKITYFELMTAMAISYFASRGVDIAVFETGLGGRLDATNILCPLISVITEISLDHTRILGSTMSLIAREKGGIIKPHTPVVFGSLKASACRALTAQARQQRAPVVPLGALASAKKLAPHLTLPGEHQIDNLRTVLAVIRELRSLGFPVSRERTIAGLEKLRWAGRFQRLSLPSGVTAIVDVAHNDSAITSLVQNFTSKYPARRATLLVGLARQKDHRTILGKLSRIASEIILTRIPTHRSAEPSELAVELDGYTGKIHQRKSVASALNLALRRTEPGGIVLLTGSHFLVGEFLRLRQQNR